MLNSKFFKLLPKPTLFVGSWLFVFSSLAQTPYLFKRLSAEVNSVEYNLNVKELNNQNLFIAFSSIPNSSPYWTLNILNFSILGDSVLQKIIVGADSSLPTLGYSSSTSFKDNRAVIGGGSTSKLPYQNRDPTLISINLDNFSIDYFKQEPRDSLNFYGQSKILSNSIVAIGYDDLEHEDGSYLVSKHKLNGDLLWSKTFGTAFFDVCTSIIESELGELYLFGGSRGYGSEPGFYNQALLIKTDSLGNELWRTTWGGYFNDCANNLAATPDGGVIACGCISEESSSGNMQVAQGYVRKMDSEGNLVWDKTYDWQSVLLGGSVHSFSVVRVLENENIIVVGSGAKLNVDTTASRNVPWAVIFDKNGNVLMERAYTSLVGDYSSAEFQDIQPTVDGGFIAGGTYYPSQGDTGNQDAFIVKLDERGCEFADCQPPLAVEELVVGSSELVVWPNPAKDVLNIETDSPMERIEVFNQLGARVFSRQYSVGSSFEMIDVSRLKPGLYFLMVKTEKGVETRKVIIN